MAPRVLVVLTSVDKIEATGKPTGWYLPELAHPYTVLESKVDFTFASPKGGVAPLDPASVEMFAKDEAAVSFLNNKKSLWENTEKLEKFAGKASQFDAILFPGGHGPMFDLANDAVSHSLVAELYSQGKPVAAVCHGPAALVNVTLPSGESILAGKEVAGFSNAEEDAMGQTQNMPFALETELNKRSGGRYVKAAELWGEKIAVSGNVITGQNPASSKALGEALAKALGV